MHRTLLIACLALCAIGLTLYTPGCDDLITETVENTIIDRPRAEFTHSATTPNVGCGPLTVNFQSLSAGPVEEWLWIFGDGDSSRDTNPEHTYDSAGYYTVRLTVVDSLERTATEIKPNYVIVQKPLADFEIKTDSNICAGTSLEFINDSRGGVSEYRWYFENADAAILDSSFRKEPEYLFNTPGKYTVTLVVSGSCNPPDTLVRTDYIQVGDCPYITFSLNVDTICSDERVVLTWVSTGGLIDSIYFAWGDNLVDTLFGADLAVDTISHLFDVTSNRSITIVADVFGPGGATNTSEPSIVRVNAVPTANFTVSPDSGDAPLTVTFSNESTNGNTYEWDFGDGSGSVLGDPTYVYTLPGTYTVTLITSNTTTGCTPDTFTLATPIIVTDTTGGK